jgi:protein tyrosine phosphatase
MEEEFKRLESENKWAKHFENLLKKTRTHSAEVGESATNKSLNRYLNVIPYDRSRVKLSRTIGNDYINANLVTVPKAARQYILTQGPLTETLGHFWLMVWEQKSTVIVMLNKCIELENFKKCEQYWPDSVNSKMPLSDVKLTVTLTKVEETKHFSIRTLLLEDDESHKSRTISQFQYKAWPDYDQPDSPTSFLRLLTAIRKSGGLDKMDEPTIVHCSAGIGRSGTFCLIDSVLSMVENQGSTEGIDIANTLLEMRDYRMGLIQSPVQLRFAYMSIIYGIKILEKANKLHPHMSSINAIDNSSLQKINGSAAQNNGKSKRRTKKKNSSANNSSALNVFNKHLLVEAMDDIDSDTADRLFEDAMIQLPSLKKARNSEPENFNEGLFKQIIQTYNDNQQDATKEMNQAISPATKAQMLTNAINSLIPGSTVSQDLDPSPTNPSADSVLLRRRDRELRNQRLAEKTMDIKNKMKAEEIKKELRASRMAFIKKSALFGGVAIVISSIAYIYLHGHKYINV